MTQTTLQTSRLRLVPLSHQHANYIVQLDSDPKVMRYVESGHPLGASDAAADHQRRLAAAQPVPGLGYWAGFVGQDFVGWWSLGPVEPTDQGLEMGHAELGYRLLPQYWKQGLAKEGGRELVRHGFQDLGLTRIAGETMAVNAASRATMAACGLRHIRTFHLQFDDPIPGTEEGEVEYAITSAEWNERSSKASGL